MYLVLFTHYHQLRINNHPVVFFFLFFMCHAMLIHPSQTLEHPPDLIMLTMFIYYCGFGKMTFNS